ncbi:MAG TPA: MFS transporter, partial [Actinoplanes sp.]|nr:MFS transporter [Actinoplanes sp.]
HSETVLMMAWVFGGAIGIIPLAGRFGAAVPAAFAVLAAIRAGIVAARLHNERLQGRPDPAVEDTDTDVEIRTPARRKPKRGKEREPVRQRTSEPEPTPADRVAPPGFHVYRPTSADHPATTSTGGRTNGNGSQRNGTGHPADDSDGTDR